MTASGGGPPRSAAAGKEAERRQRREAALALRASQVPTGPASERLRVASWNVNSLRARQAAVERFLVLVQPDVLCLQETKTAAVAETALQMLAEHGFDIAHAGAGSYNGVAVVSRHPISDVQVSGEFGDEHLDREPRLVSCVVGAPLPMRVASVYVPHGRTVDHWHYEYKLAFLDALAAQVRTWLRQDRPLLVAGDLNVATTDSDVFHPDAFRGSTHVTPPEREALGRFLDAGLVDVDVQRWGARARRFTWWNYGIGYSRNLGMRLDVIAADHDLARRLDTTWIDHAERSADRPSDHAALVADFHLQPPG
jgi:exodeoxyribonuclease-3